ncbi:MAG TPA: efflux RND transporter periplasmic adaptor subunit [Burkholderiales bacterium]|nr:efflux RND transporter periplasmic adaptor subunit [Burkholderiales bacterium]
MKRTILLIAVAAAAQAAIAQPATAPVEFRDVAEVYAADGVVEAVRQSIVAAQIAGRIVELRTDVGDRVAKGQVLARIDEREAAQVVASSEAQIARATADLANATANLERTRKLVKQKFVSEAALDRAQSEHDAASAALAAAKAGTGAATAARSYTVITAPFAGVISERPVQLGEMAQPGRPLFTMFDPSDLRVLASVPEDVIARVRTGAKGAAAELPALATTVPAKSVTVLPAADARTHTKLVRLDLPDGDATKGAYPGMFARALFATGAAKRLLIPERAVAYRSEVAGAYVVTPAGEIRFRQLRLGEKTADGAIEVLAGLSAGERVALDPVAALSALKQAVLKGAPPVPN